MNKIKTFIKKNSKKIAIGVGLVALAGTAGYFGYNRIRLTEQVKSNDSIINNLIDSNSALKHSNATLQEAVKAYKEDHEEVTFLKFLVIESDCVPKALQNAENKLARK